MAQTTSIRIKRKTATSLKYLIIKKRFSSYAEAIDWLLASTKKRRAR